MQKESQNSKLSAKDALALLEQAWAYYAPEPAPVDTQHEPDLFEYANAA